MKIYNAIITKQRILFVGHNQCAGDMSQLVLSAVAMISPTIPGIIRRVFPYCSISDLSFLNVHGYIAAVTNPMYVLIKKLFLNLFLAFIKYSVLLFKYIML